MRRGRLWQIGKRDPQQELDQALEYFAQKYGETFAEVQINPTDGELASHNGIKTLTSTSVPPGCIFLVLPEIERGHEDQAASTGEPCDGSKLMNLASRLPDAAEKAKKSPSKPPQEKIPCPDCGKLCNTRRGLAIHQARGCPGKPIKENLDAGTESETA